MKNILMLIFFLLSVNILAQVKKESNQTGIIKGTVIEQTNNEPLFSAQVQVIGLKVGTLTDFNGQFEIELPPGEYDLNISFLGLQSITIENIKVDANSTTFIKDILLKEGDNELEEVIVTGKSIHNTESSILMMRVKSVNVMDGLSTEMFNKIGDGDAASAVKRIPGVSIQSGKYVYVRGLGDRYTKTTLNGMNIPGLDPDRNSLQIDIFPTNIVDNIIIYKTFDASMPADFTGGIVNIETKEFPDKASLNFSFDLGFTPGMHFNSDYRSQKGGSLDFLGFDDGGRNEPLNMNILNPNPTGEQTDPRLKPDADGTTSKFNNELGSKIKKSPMDFGFGISGGNKYKTENRTYGWVGSVSYKNNTIFYEDWQQNYYRKNTNANITELRDERLQNGDLGINNVLISGMLGGSVKNIKSNYKVNLLHLQNGESKSGLMSQQDLISTNNEQIRHNLEYSERSITNLIISGDHFLVDDWILEWSISPTYSKIADKDVRLTNYVIDRNSNGEIINYSIDPSEGSFPKRIWRSLYEYNFDNRVDIAHEHGKSSKIRFGMSYTLKLRDYSILDYELRTLGNLTGLSGNGDELMSDNYLWSSLSPSESGTYIHGQFQENNTYSSSQSIVGFYISEEFYLTSKLRSIVGIRLEKYDQFYTGQNQIANTSPSSPPARIFNNQKVVSDFQLFPSINFIYQVNDMSNLRFNYAMTTARPSFKEISTAEIVDVISGTTFIGNIDLVQTDIHNFDVRYESLSNNGQVLSISGFYKNLKNPIELISYEQDNMSFQPRNVGNARILGLELEARKKVNNSLSINTNISFINSRVAYDKRPGGDYDGKENGLRSGENLKSYRDMQGQSPFIINTGMIYQNDNEYEVGLFYNVQGPKLINVGINFTPDVYSVPFHSLNLNASKTFNKLKINLRFENLLNDSIEMITKSFKSKDKIYNKINPGVQIGLSINYEI